ncbi:hypothetical protein K490DRAFT_46222 [Saccharata proteae CBS 121410]|uniref:Uncharacterized protein n=1 Tax=Saccharata proteae CBS 121410 TaxID=1314787 RepID=A0A9P4HPU2_9PEZI|nr:hypothetical protein K490DRAFT_46222 [Saccharata proteae CBS 121410]
MEHKTESVAGTRAASVESNGIHSPGQGLPQRTTTGGKFKRHCRKFWWLDFLIFAAIVLVIVLPIVYVGVPNEAQSEVDKTTLVVNAQDVTNPEPNSVGLALNSTLTSHSRYHPNMDAFNVSLFLENTEPDIEPFGYIEIPKTHIDSKTSIDVNQTMQVADMDQFIAYNKLVIGSEEFRVAMRGKPQMKLSGIPEFKVNFNKVVTMKGLNQLSGSAITSAQLINPPAADGATMSGTVSIPNPSVLNLTIGTVAMNLSVDSTPIGTSTIKSLVLSPGNNTADMRAIVNTTLVLGLVSTNYTDGVLPIEAVGTSCVNDEGEALVYYEEALADVVLRLDLNLTEALTAASGS